MLSEEKRQESLVPQGSILSVTLFAMKVNSLAAVIPNYTSTSIFVDDLQILFNVNSVSETEIIIQPVLNDIYQWETKNEFRFQRQK